MLGHGCGPEEQWLFSGYLEKESKGNNWNKRFFVLEETSLKYFKKRPDEEDPDSLQCRGEIRMKKITKVEESSVWTGKDYCFVLEMASGPNIYLVANSKENMAEWIDSLQVHSPPNPNQDRHAQTSNKQPVSESGYQTKVVGGVVIRKKITSGDSTAGINTSMEMSDSSISTRAGDVDPSLAQRCMSSCSVSSTMRQQSVSIPQGAGHRRDGARVVKSGYCVKEGGVRKNWKRRFFLLDPFGLAYYRFREDKEPLKNVPLPFILSVGVSQKGLNIDRDYVLEVATVGRIFYMQTESMAECLEWIDAIKSILPDHHTPSTTSIPCSPTPKPSRTKPLMKNAQQLWRYSVGKCKAYLQESSDSEEETPAST